MATAELPLTTVLMGSFVHQPAARFKPVNSTVTFAAFPQKVAGPWRYSGTAVLTAGHHFEQAESRRLLSQLARQGRSWGFPVWMASQDADKFLTTGTNETNFADLAECGVHFSPQTLSAADQKLILGGVIHQKFKKAEAALRLQGKMHTSMARQFWKDGGK